MTYQELMQHVQEGVLSFDHDAWHRGYISRKTARDESYQVVNRHTGGLETTIDAGATTDSS